jgi:hypothetical protein
MPLTYKNFGLQLNSVFIPKSKLPNSLFFPYSLLLTLFLKKTKIKNIHKQNAYRLRFLKYTSRLMMPIDTVITEVMTNAVGKGSFSGSGVGVP